MDSISSSTFLSNMSLASSQPAATEANGTLTQEDFLALLITQMENQDPLDPLDTETYTQQLTNYTSLEYQIETNDLLTEISSQLSATGGDSMLGYIGNEVSVATQTMGVSGDSVTEVSFTLDSAADVEMVIYDLEGNEIAHVDSGTAYPGTSIIQWDGLDSSGEKVADGSYVYAVTATGTDGESVPVQTFETGEVTGISYFGDEPWLMVCGNPVSPSSVIAVNKA